MAVINNTPYRFTSTTQVDQREQTRMLSNRYAEPMAKTSVDGAVREQNPSTEVAPGAKAGVAITSARNLSGSSVTAPSDSPRNDFDSMGAFRALIARFQRAGDGEGAQYRPQASGAFELTLTTRDGDTVTLSLDTESAQAQGAGGDSAAAANAEEFSFLVAGELDDQEREALNALVGRLGDITSAYRESGWAEIKFLDAFDSKVLTGLDLNLKESDGHALQINYSLGSSAASHALAVNQNGYEYELSADIYFSEVESKLEENALYAQYQQALIDTTRSYKAGEFSGGVAGAEAEKFFLDGLEAMLSPLNGGSSDTKNNDLKAGVQQATGVIDGEELSSGADKAAAIGAVSAQQNKPLGGSAERTFLSGLPDFTASFHTPGFTPNDFNRSEVSQMSLNLGQITEVQLKPSTDGKVIEQRYTLESRVSQHFGIAGDNIKHANFGSPTEPGGQTYLYETVRRATEHVRALEVDAEGRAVGYQQSKDTEHVKTTKAVVEGETTGVQKEDLTDPADIYSYAAHLLDSQPGFKVQALQVEGYKDIQMLHDMLDSQRIDLYS